jgi:zinc protease
MRAPIAPIDPIAPIGSFVPVAPIALVASFARLMIAAFVACAVGSLGAMTPSALAAPQLVRTLPNKATLIVRESRTRPVVAIQVYVRAGSRDESRSERGVAAVLSHLPWEGNERRSKADVDQLAGMVGGRWDSQVAAGFILYEMDVPARAFGQAVEALGDIILHPTFERKPVENAKSAARTRSRNALGHAVLASMNPIREALHPGNALGSPASVPEREIEAVTSPLVQRFHGAWFTGENLMIVVAGDVDPEEAATAVAAAFGTASTKRSPTRPKIQEKPLAAPKVIGATNPDGAGGSSVTIGFRTPAWGTADALALDALVALLADYRDARLQHRIAESPFLGASAQRSFEADGGTVAFSIAASPETFAEAEGVLFSEIERARFTPIGADELKNTIDAMIARDLVFQQDLAGVGRATAYSAMQTKPGADEVYAQRLRALRPEDLVAVARQYLDPKQSVVVYMAPRDIVDSLNLYAGLEARAREKMAVAAAAYGAGPGATVTSAEDRRRRIDAPLATLPPPRDAGRGRVARATVDGIRVLASEDATAPVATIAVYLEGSVRHEHEKNNGVTKLLLETILTSSDPQANGLAYRFSLPEMGRFAPYQDRDMWGYSLTVPAARWKEALTRMGAMMSHPEIDTITVDATRLLVLDEQTNWLNSDVARRRHLIFPTKYEVSGYRFPLLGSRSALVGLGVPDVAGFYSTFVVKPNLVVAVFGDVRAEEVAPAVAHAFRDVSGKAYAPGTVAKEGAFENFREKWELGQGPECTVSIAFDGPPAAGAEVPALYVVNSLFNNPRGWFQTYVREKTAFVREIDSYVSHTLDECTIVATVSTPGPPSEETVVRMLFGQFRSAAGIRLEGDFAQDLENAKRHATGLFQMGLQSNSARAFQHARAEVFRLPADYVLTFPAKLQSVTSQDVQGLAFRYFQYPNAGRRPYAVAETRPGGW